MAFYDTIVYNYEADQGPEPAAVSMWSFPGFRTLMIIGVTTLTRVLNLRLAAARNLIDTGPCPHRHRD